MSLFTIFSIPERVPPTPAPLRCRIWVADQEDPDSQKQAESALAALEDELYGHLVDILGDDLLSCRAKLYENGQVLSGDARISRNRDEAMSAQAISDALIARIDSRLVLSLGIELLFDGE